MTKSYWNVVVWIKSPMLWVLVILATFVQMTWPLIKKVLNFWMQVTFITTCVMATMENCFKNKNKTKLLYTSNQPPLRYGLCIWVLGKHSKLKFKLWHFDMWPRNGGHSQYLAKKSNWKIKRKYKYCMDGGMLENLKQVS